MGVQSYREGQVLFWNKEHRKPVTANGEWAAKWEKRSKEHGKPNQIIGCLHHRRDGRPKLPRRASSVLEQGTPQARDGQRRVGRQMGKTQQGTRETQPNHRLPSPPSRWASKATAKGKFCSGTRNTASP